MSEKPSGDFLTDGNVSTTVLFLNQVWHSATMRRLTDGHRHMTQHQLTITSPVPVSGSVNARIIPDTIGSVILDSVDIGQVLTLDNNKSAIATFSGVLRGIELVELESFGPDAILTIVLSSTRGQG